MEKIKFLSLDILFCYSASFLCSYIFDKKIAAAVAITYTATKIIEFTKKYFSNEIDILESRIKYVESDFYKNQVVLKLQTEIQALEKSITEKQLNLNFLENENLKLKKADGLQFGILSGLIADVREKAKRIKELETQLKQDQLFPEGDHEKISFRRKITERITAGRFRRGSDFSASTSVLKKG